ncbi:potassium channel family protein [Candidatus Poribacteria bacterium]
MKPIHFRLRAFLVVLLAAVALGSIGFAVVEDLPLVDAFYLTMVTIATVGYGDVHPITQVGKFLAITVTVMGVGTFLGVITITTDMLLSKRGEQARLQQQNMVIGIFFSEVGTKLLALISGFSSNLDGIRREVIVDKDWNEQDFLMARERFENVDHGIDIRKGNAEELQKLLVDKRPLLVSLMQNPTLMEHESFTDLLRAVFHLTEELTYREDIMQLPDSDNAHLTGDAKRVQDLLVDQWLRYMEYLRDNYPYLFSLALRTNPFDEAASPIIE